ncbi:MFS general substrate transporter [Melanomma pulvis-pyrius CBS 109.77]|uniref:MFS general substrate transporter n=1 Tax=Melanomma pulvis-pyrius CBS 109.77 TaxID=1314802 RepID=A0A6A6X022_9PLEO|nr:MFS general substrate transporter [Melanomma pulvis-pyrius CBS 109.77]
MKNDSTTPQNLQPLPIRNTVTHATTQADAMSPSLSGPNKNTASQHNAPVFHIDKTITVPLASKTIYSPEKGIYVGHRKDILPPASMETEWLAIRQRLVTDLQPVIQSLPLSLQQSETTIELELCMAGEVVNKSKQIQLRPTIWIRCGGKQCQKVVRQAMNDLTYFPTFTIQVHTKAPVPASTSFSTHGASLAAMASGANPIQIHMESGGIQIQIQKYSNNSFSACGLKIRIKSDEGYHMCTIGGLVKVDGKLFGLTTAHSIFKADTQTGIDSIFKTHNLERTDSSTIEHKFPNYWSQTTLVVASYPGHRVLGGNLEGSPASNTTDIALVNMENGARELQNWYKEPASTTDNTSRTYSVDNIPSILQSGAVSIICSCTDVRPGFLLDGDALFFDRVGMFHTKKIQTEEPLELGLSGTWVTRGSDLLGMIVAIYEDEPYAHMLPIHQVFSDIKSLLAKDGHLPKVEIDIGVSSMGIEQGDRIIDILEPFDEKEVRKDSRPEEKRLKRMREQDVSNTLSPTENGTSEDNRQDTPAHNPFNENHILSGLYLAIFLTGLCLMHFAIGLDTTAFPTVMPTITDRFDSLNHIGWYGTAYLLAMCTAYPTFINLYTHYQSKWLHLASFFIFELGCLLCGVSSNSATLIAGRTISGIGAAGSIIGAGVVVRPLVPTHRKEQTIGFVGLWYGVGRLVGSLLGGALTEHFTWRWSFYFNLCVGALALIIIGPFNFPRIPCPEVESKFRLVSFNSVCILVATVCLLLGLHFGVIGAWNDPQVIGLFVPSGVILLFLIVKQWPKKNSPPDSFWSIEHRAWITVFSSAICGSCFPTLNHFLPTWFQTIQEAKPTESAVKYLPTLVTATIVPVMLMLGLGPHQRRWRIHPIINLTLSCCLMAIGSGLLSTFKDNTSSSKIIGYQILFSIGAGLGSIQATIDMMYNTINYPSEGIDRKFQEVIPSHALGGAISISVAQTVFMGLFTKTVRRHIPEAAFVLKGGATNFRGKTTGPILEATLVAFNDSFTRVFLVPAAACALSIPIVCFHFFGRWRHQVTTPSPIDARPRVPLNN